MRDKEWLIYIKHLKGGRGRIPVGFGVCRPRSYSDGSELWQVVRVSVKGDFICTKMVMWSGIGLDVALEFRERTLKRYEHGGRYVEEDTPDNRKALGLLEADGKVREGGLTWSHFWRR